MHEYFWMIITIFITNTHIHIYLSSILQSSPDNEVFKYNDWKVCGALPKSFSSKNDRLSVDNKQDITMSIFDVI